MKAEIDFYNLEPEKFPTLNLAEYPDGMLTEMAYFLWCMYPEDVGLMLWRKEKLLPLVLLQDESVFDDDI